MAGSADLRSRMGAILRSLARTYPDARISLDFADPFQLYVATVLSAQCTDARVNQVTPALFARFPTARAMAATSREEIERLIRPTGFFRNKAKSIHAAAQRIAMEFGGELPRTMDELLTLPGVGRKTANVILGNAFHIPGITVDTHVRRLSQRLGLTCEEDPVKIEFELMAITPRRAWTDLSHRLIWHGRQVCRARKPLCPECALLAHCPYGRKHAA
jgi:endonuclease III